jgi:Flp pilus assembly pilin Flp
MKWSEMKKKLSIARAKRSALGRFICRLAGDECGAVMMEYVILGVLVAAAVVVAVMFFARNIRTGFNVMGQTTAGQSQNAANLQSNAKQIAQQAVTQSETHRKAIEDK